MHSVTIYTCIFIIQILFGTNTSSDLSKSSTRSSHTHNYGTEFPLFERKPIVFPIIINASLSFKSNFDMKMISSNRSIVVIEVKVQSIFFP